MEEFATRGWTQGYPKRLGRVFQTRCCAATGKAGPALAAESKFAGSLTTGGQRLAEGLVTSKETGNRPVALEAAADREPPAPLRSAPGPNGAFHGILPKREGN